jgi:hypothetical protein
MGFITADGNYGAFQYGDKWMVVYQAQQLDVFDTIEECKKYILSHRAGKITTPKQRIPKPKSKLLITSPIKKSKKLIK